MYLLHVLYRSGRGHTLRFPTAFARALLIVTLSAQPVTLTLAEAA
jgi:hypothetical protein